MKDKKDIAIFYSDNDFEAKENAVAFCKAIGYSVGSMCRDMPIPMSNQYEVVGKWDRMTYAEQNMLDGGIESEDFRHGPVHVFIYK